MADTQAVAFEASTTIPQNHLTDITVTGPEHIADTKNTEHAITKEDDNIQVAIMPLEDDTNGDDLVKTKTETDDSGEVADEEGAKDASLAVGEPGEDASVQEIIKLEEDRVRCRRCVTRLMAELAPDHGI